MLKKLIKYIAYKKIKNIGKKNKKGLNPKRIARIIYLQKRIKLRNTFNK